MKVLRYWVGSSNLFLGVFKLNGENDPSIIWNTCIEPGHFEANHDLRKVRENSNVGMLPNFADFFLPFDGDRRITWLFSSDRLAIFDCQVCW